MTPMTTRPFNPDAFSDILEAIANGERVHRACSNHGYQWRHVWTWMAEDTTGSRKALYARARAASALHWAERATETVEQCPPEKNAVALARLQEDHYRWRAKVANPKEYGEADNADADAGAVRIGAVFVLPALNPPPTPPAHLLDPSLAVPTTALNDASHSASALTRALHGTADADEPRA